MMNIYRGASAWRAESLPIFENPKFAHQNLDIESCPPKFSHRNFYNKNFPTEICTPTFFSSKIYQQFFSQIFPPIFTNFLRFYQQFHAVVYHETLSPSSSGIQELNLLCMCTFCPSQTSLPSMFTEKSKNL